MHGMSAPELFVLLLLALLLFGRRPLPRLAEDINEGIANFVDRFRGGGPPTPMHPSPANDGALLRRRSRKRES
jgi:hypothetical protein